MTKSIQLIIVAAAALALAGCSKKPPASLPLAPTAQDSQPDAYQTGVLPGSQAAFLAEMGGRETITLTPIDTISTLSMLQRWLPKFNG